MKNAAFIGLRCQFPFGCRLRNEIEFLGDSVLSAAVAHYLFNRYPDVDEGRLSQLKSMLVSRPSLTVWGREIGLGEFLRLSEGEALAGGRDRNSIVGNARNYSASRSGKSHSSGRRIS